MYQMSGRLNNIGSILLSRSNVQTFSRSSFFERLAIDRLLVLEMFERFLQEGRWGVELPR